MGCILCHYHAGSKCDWVYFQQAACQKVIVAVKMLVIQLWWAIGDTRVQSKFPYRDSKVYLILFIVTQQKLPAYDRRL